MSKRHTPHEPAVSIDVDGKVRQHIALLMSKYVTWPTARDVRDNYDQFHLQCIVKVKAIQLWSCAA